jgi:hydrogenase expression/formation protein HypD
VPVNNQELLDRLRAYSGPAARLMEVCGTHTMAIARFGIQQALSERVELVSGPGCPVCVCEPGVVSAAVKLAKNSGLILATFGDMLLVPAGAGSLSQARAAGGDVRVVYSPAQAVTIAEQNPQRPVVFLAVGFETTAPAIAGAVKMAKEKKLTNLSFLISLRTIPPALRALSNDPEVRLSGFLLPGHVSVIIGVKPYQLALSDSGLPGVVAGFTAEDILGAIDRLLALVSSRSSAVENAYPRAVRFEGNSKAQKLLAEVFVPADISWRGLGIIPESGLVLANAYQEFDACRKHSVKVEDESPPAGCCCGDVLAGRIRPTECALFSSSCTPQSPVGPCMVSSEGTCAAYYKYGRGPAAR